MHGNSKEEAQNEVSYQEVSRVLIPSQFDLLLLLKDISFGVGNNILGAWYRGEGIS